MLLTGHIGAIQLGLGLAPGAGGGVPAVLILSGSDWYADSDPQATADGYAVSDGNGGYVIDDAVGSGLPVFLRGSRAYLEI